VTDPETSDATDAEKRTVVRILSAAAFVIFFQSYMVGPLAPKLALSLHITANTAAMLVPAYVLPYGLSTLFYGPLADRVGRRRVMLGLLVAMPVVILVTALARSETELLIWRIAAGIATGGIVPLSLALIGDLFPYRRRGRPLGQIFGAIAGGMAFGSTLAAVAEPWLGWRGVFVVVGVASFSITVWVWPHRRLLDSGRRTAAGAGSIVRGYLSLLSTPRGRSAYGIIALNGAFHSGVFTFLGIWLADTFHLGEIGIGIALIGYGLPGLFLAPFVGSLADRFGRRWLIASGLILAAAVTAALATPIPLVAAGIAVTMLSFGFDLSHPLLAGIVTELDPARRGQAMGLNAFVLFTGFGLGSLLFGGLLRYGFPVAFVTFAIVLAIAGICSPMLFRSRVIAGSVE
jgi:predicted MFS family arabinose efflux permease